MIASWARSSHLPLLLLVFLVTAGVCLPAWAGGGAVLIENPTLAGKIVRMNVVNGTSEKAVIDVTAQYDNGKTVESATARLVLGPGGSMPVDLYMPSLIEGPDPILGITEGPDPIPQMVVVASVLWSD